MATLQTDEANIIEAEAINWRWVVYPLLIALVVGAGAFGFYYYKQNQQDLAETEARAALIKASTPDEFLKVAADFPQTDQATLAILKAADASFDKQDYDGALGAYRKIIEDSTLGEQWHDTAILGSGSAYEAKGDTDKAITAYMDVAHRGDQSAFAPYAYDAVARIYNQRGDKNNERLTLQAAASLNPDSTFTRRAQNMLKQMDAAVQPPLTVNVPGATNAPPANSALAPVPPTK